MQRLLEILKDHPDKLVVQYRNDYGHSDYVIGENAYRDVYEPLISFFRLQWYLMNNTSYRILSLLVLTYIYMYIYNHDLTVFLMVHILVFSCKAILCSLLNIQPD